MRYRKHAIDCLGSEESLKKKHSVRINLHSLHTKLVLVLVLLLLFLPRDKCNDRL